MLLHTAPLLFVYSELLVYCVLLSFERSCYVFQFFAYDLYVVDVAQAFLVRSAYVLYLMGVYAHDAGGGGVCGNRVCSCNYEVQLDWCAVYWA